MRALFLNLRQALRALGRAPAYSVAVVLTLGLGLGLNAAVFSVVYGILFRTFDLPDSGRLMVIWQDMTERGGDRYEWTGRGVFSGWRERNRSFQAMTAVIAFPADLTGGDMPEQVPGAVVSHEYFSVLGLEPASGRGFLPQEERVGDHLAVVLSHGLWQRRFGGDSDLIGRTITINGAEHVVVGIQPPGFRAPLAPSTQLWAPLPLVPTPQDWGYSYLRVLGRLADGVTPAAAQADMDRVAAALRADHPEALRDVGAAVQALTDAVVGPARRLLLILLAAVTLVLLAACVNVASLTLARATARRSEIAVRSALGAGRVQIAGRLLGEVLLLAAGGAVLGLLVGIACLALLRGMAPPQMPRLDAVRLDGTVFVYTLLLSLAAGLLAGLLPAFAVWRRQPAQTLRQASGAAGDTSARRWRNVLVAAEVALGLVLMIGAGLLVRTLHNLSRVDLGFQADNLALGRLTLAPDRYPEPGDLSGFLSQLEQGLSGRREIAAAGAVSSLPLADPVGEYPFLLEGGDPAAAEEAIAIYRAASPGYFQALAIPLRSGRFFTAADVASAPPVAMVSERFVERFLAGRDPLGQRLRIQEIDAPADPWRTLVGVVGDLRGRGVDQPPLAEIYVPLAQEPPVLVTVVVRPAGVAAAAFDAIREEAGRMRSDQVVADLTTMDEVLADALSPRRFAAGLIGASALVVLVLVGVGIYGTMALAVAQRRREIAVRLAVGAPASSVVGLVLRWSGSILAGGIGVGIGIAVAGRQALSSLLYEIEGMDPVTVVATVLLIAVVGFAAGLGPALRAARVDPAKTLKSEA